MSVIKPNEYKLIADQLGQAYAKIRDAVYLDGATAANAARDDIATIKTIVDGSNDTDFGGSAAALPGATLPESEDIASSNFSNWIANTTSYTAPKGSISQDIGKAIFTALNTEFNFASAKRIAAAQLQGILRTLNSHVTKRMNNVSTITAYYSTYGYNTDFDTSLTGVEGGLFDSSTTSGLQGPDYFSAEFQELSGELGITIAAEFVV